jgi:tRNA-dihydrouridine synthase B
MIGRAAQGNPWIFKQIQHRLATGEDCGPPDTAEIGRVLLGHISGLHDFYGAQQGVRVARKHIGWYLSNLPQGEAMRRQLVRVEDPDRQLRLLQRFFEDPDLAIAA